jgi:2-oxo-4-hydroxy-4-carboxy--5-ureidoimidazoline (OHCU) decarboxylase
VVLPARNVPRELMASPTPDELAELFEGRTRLVERLARESDPLSRAHTLVHELPIEEKKEVLAAHPAIGQRTGLSERSAAEQGADAEPEVLAELARLNADYERQHGFRFVVFVNRRPKAEILEVLKRRIDRPTDAELETALDELVAIAEDRWRRR